MLALMAEGRDNSTSPLLVVTEGAVHKHIGNIFAQARPAPHESDSGHRRVLAVLAYLGRDAG